MAPVTIFVVDNNPAVLDVAKAILLSSSYNVVTAESGEQALRTLEANPPIDLVLSEAALPGLSGRDLVHDIVRLYPATKVMLMTGDANSDLLLDPDVPFLPKPFTFSDLTRQVELVLAQSRETRRSCKTNSCGSGHPCREARNRSDPHRSQTNRERSRKRLRE